MLFGFNALQGKGAVSLFETRDRVSEDSIWLLRPAVERSSKLQGSKLDLRIMRSSRFGRLCI